jgi:hypothetical protein
MSRMEVPEGGGFLSPDFLIVFTRSETESIADAMSAGATAAGFIPDPVVSKVVAASGALIALMARRAVRKDKTLGIKVRIFPPGYIIPFIGLYASIYARLALTRIWIFSLDLSRP